MNIENWIVLMENQSCSSEKIFPRQATLQLLREIQMTMEENRIETEQLRSTHLHVDVLRHPLGDIENDVFMANSSDAAVYAARFLKRHWSLFRKMPAWQMSKSKETTELLRIIISVNQLSVYRKVSDWCEEVAQHTSGLYSTNAKIFVAELKIGIQNRTHCCVNLNESNFLINGPIQKDQLRHLNKIRKHLSEQSWRRRWFYEKDS